MIRIVIILAVIGIVIYLINLFIASVKSNRCKHCEGYGYWKGTRGEKNFCKVCDGTGKKVVRNRV